jgi:hypothetical protein
MANKKKTIPEPSSKPLAQNDTIDESEPDQTYLRSVNTEGFGLAKRIYVDGKFLHTVNANLPELNQGEAYLCWLMKEDSPDTYIATGELTYLDNDLFLFYESDKNLSALTKVLVTKQPKNLNTPGEPVLVGHF